MNRNFCCAVLLAFLAVAQSAHGTVNVEAMARMVVLDRNRKKPLDTYARTTLLMFSGKRRVEGRSAVEWLAEVLFDAQAAETRRVFLVDNPEIADALGIERRKRRYSYADLRPAMEKIFQTGEELHQKPPAQRSRFESDMIRLHDNVFEYTRIASGLGYLDPHPMLALFDSVAQTQLGLDEIQVPSYWDMLQRSEKLAVTVRRLQRDTAAAWNSGDSAMVRAMMSMMRLQAGIGNPPPHLVPGLIDGSEQWFGPWGYVARFGTSALTSGPLVELAAMRAAYRAADLGAFEAAVEAFIAAVKGSEGVEVSNVGLEVMYNRLDPIGRSRIAFGLAMLCSLAVFAGATGMLRRVGLALAAAGFAMLSAGLAMRMGITARPPVTNLYETFVFVAWSCAALGIALEFTQRSGAGLLCAAAGGFAFVHAAGRFGLDGDSMGMLAAVLNSNFWLATHIMTISLGYAGCAAAAAIAHVYLVKRCAGSDEASCAPLDRALHGMLLFGLTFTVAGTVLGGLWADQSWGRFWGWDPKENGALLIILWCAAVLHARAGRLVGGPGSALGCVVLFILVMFAWLGVNLLGVGLHSYGFTTRGAVALYTVVSAETVFAAVAAGILYWRRRPYHPPS